MKRPITLTVNGQDYQVLADTRQTLLELLREGLRLTGTKEGCSNGNCGACAVLLDGRAVDSCLVLALEAAGRQVTTIEGISQNGKLTPLQEAFVEVGGFECGFCTPGVIVSATALLRANPHPSEAEIRQAMAGHLCRCTGYDKIVRAISLAAQPT